MLPVIGSKELIGSVAAPGAKRAPGTWLNHQLAYPTHGVWCRAGRRRGPRGRLADGVGPRVPWILHLNSPPTLPGGVLPPDHLRKVVDWCRATAGRSWCRTSATWR
ncbi:MAG: hypothetical protein R2734_07810 [Nocardioides sp.]